MTKNIQRFFFLLQLRASNNYPASFYSTDGANYLA